MSDIVIFILVEVYSVDRYKSIVFLLLTTERINRKIGKKKCFCLYIRIIILIKTFFFLEQRVKAQDLPDDPLGEMEMSNVIARKQQRTGNKINSKDEVNIYFLIYIICCIVFFY
jgi:hypothetical protein